MLTCCDCLDGLRKLDEGSVSLCVTDPPYEWGFMGKKWDTEPVAEEVWSEVLRVLKPGASCFVFVGARQDVVARRIVQLADAGFDVQHSSLTWCFANGNMPKSTNLGKDADKAAFVAWVKAVPEGETETRAALMGWGNGEVRKAASAAVGGEAARVRLGDERAYPDSLNVWIADGRRGEDPADARTQGAALLASLVERFGEAPGARMKVGELGGRYASGFSEAASKALGVNVAAARSDGGGWTGEGLGNITAPSTLDAQALDGWHGGAVPLKPMHEQILWATKPRDKGPIRDNVLQHGTGGVNIEAARVPTEDTWERRPCHGRPAGTALHGNVDGSLNREWSPSHPAGRYPPSLLVTSRALGDNSKYGDIDAWAAANGLDAEWLTAALEGVVWMPKPSRGEKNAGCEGLPVKATRQLDGGPLPYIDTAHAHCDATNRRGRPSNNNHPTTKPVTLIAYLIALACPEDGVVLDPFLGSGTTAVAAVALGREWVGFEREAEYCRIAEARVAHAERQLKLGGLFEEATLP